MCFIVLTIRVIRQFMAFKQKQVLPTTPISVLLVGISQF